MDQHTEIMDKCLKEIAESKTPPVLIDDKYEAVVKFLSKPGQAADRNFKYWVMRNRKFQLMDLTGPGVKNALVIPARKKGDSNNSSEFLRVLPQSKVFEVMQEIHGRELNHAGYKKCRDFVSIVSFLNCSLILTFKLIDNKY